MSKLARIRQENLKLLIKEHYQGSQKDFCDAHHMSKQQVNNLVNGTANMGEKIMQRIEAVNDLEIGWFNQPQVFLNHSANKNAEDIVNTLAKVLEEQLKDWEELGLIELKSSVTSLAEMFRLVGIHTVADASESTNIVIKGVLHTLTKQH